MAKSGSFYWNELQTRDVEKAKAFYTRVLGWDVETMPMEHGGEYFVLKNGGTPAGGIMDVNGSGAPEGTPNHWFSYVAVDDVDATVERTQAAGGTVLNGPFDAPGVGRIAIVVDPTGAILGVMTPVEQS